LGYKYSVNIDLHVHSTASDGTRSPAEIIALAHRIRLGALAITDHDTIDGVKAAVTAGIPDNLGFLTGVEISAERPPWFPGSGSIHILGYAFDLNHPRLNQTLDRLQEARRTRNPRILERLNDFGMDLTMSELAATVEPDGQLGRPHIATMMVQKGYARDINDAFDRYLGTGQPAYVDKYRVPCDDAVHLIRKAGGIAVVAHPVLLSTPGGRLDSNLVASLKGMGFGGLEVYYPEHSPELTAHYADMARRHGLLMTGGSDFHGDLKPTVKMGSGAGDLCVPMTLFHDLVAAAGGDGR
jgi:3',5'-nucleoside bisphosphate phosphatase